MQQQAVNTYLPTENFFCVRASYEEKSRPSFLWRYTIEVNNVAKDATGNEFGGELCAFQKDSNDPAKLAVAPCFLPKAFAGDYWVIAYDESAGYALVSGGQPTIKNETSGGCQTGTGVNDSGLWIFTRQQTRDDNVVDAARKIAQAEGFDLSVLLDVEQEGCVYDSGSRRGLRGILYA